MNLTIDVTDVLRWGRYLEQVSRELRPACARALNAFGVQVVRSMASTIAESRGLEVGAVAELIRVREATASDLTWEADASSVVSPAVEWHRPWDARSTAEFEKQALVKIVTTGDGRDCDLCNDVAENSPYTLDEVEHMAAKWAGFKGAGGSGVRTNIVHPNCRCITQPWTMTRRMPLMMGEGHGAPRELMNARQLGQAVAEEMQVTIRAVGK